MRRPAWEYVLVATVGLLLAWALAGCGTDRNEQQNTIEQETWEAGPTAVETPFGTFVVHKTAAVRKLSRYRTTTEQQQYTFPEAREIGGAILGGLTGPLAGGGIVGLLAAGAGWVFKRRNDAEKAELDAQRLALERQRNEVVAGVERAKSRLPKDSWDVLTTHLEAEQSADTKREVAKLTE